MRRGESGWGSAGEEDSTVAVFPPYVSTRLESLVSRAELKAKGELGFSPPVPDTYDDVTGK
jgi:hypothetical protein